MKWLSGHSYVCVPLTQSRLILFFLASKKKLSLETDRAGFHLFFLGLGGENVREWVDFLEKSY